MSNGKNALVTGATSGIGRACVERLAGDGFKVWAVGRNEAILDELARKNAVIPIIADVRNITSITHALGDVDIDVLVNNAGILSTRASFQEIDPAEIDAMIDINLKAPMHLTRAVLPKMIKRKSGHLIFLGSSGGRAAYPNMAAYGPSKAGISLFCDNLRCDLLGTGIRVSEIVPGRVETDLYKNALGREQAQAALYDGYRPVKPENIAELIAKIIELPNYVDVSRLEVFPTDQASGGGTMVKYQDS